MSLTACILCFVMSSAIASPLCASDQWEGFRQTTVGYSRPSGVGISKMDEILHYDYTNRRQSIVSTIYNNGVVKNHFLSVIRYNGQTGKDYLVDLDTGKCDIVKQTKPFLQMCIPAYFKYQKDIYLGRVGDFKISLFAGMSDNWSYKIATTDNSSSLKLPVHMSILGQRDQNGNTSFMYDIDYFNVTLGIRSPSVFNVPSQCNQMETDSLFGQPSPLFYQRITRSSLLWF